ncbi:MAG TPA: site-2 protease family protein [Thermoanaerobaculia bacterium]|nr:site-2 protease family protein [Thermoanaerobaculia bacterium]
MIYLGVLILLSLLILIHEAGHLVAARLAGIPVSGFSVGFGPRVWSRRWGATEYSLRALPLGGYVQPALDADGGDEGFRAIALRRRLVFFLGGPLANLAAALPLFAAYNGMAGGRSFYALAVAPFAQVAGSCWHVLNLLPDLFRKPEAMSGVIGVVVDGGQLAASGGLVELALSLTISLAVLNLFPIPILDGGQIVMSCLEELFPRLARLRVPLTLAGLVLLVGLMVYVNVQDVVRHWG